MRNLFLALFVLATGAFASAQTLLSYTVDESFYGSLRVLTVEADGKVLYSSTRNSDKSKDIVGVEIAQLSSHALEALNQRLAELKTTEELVDTNPEAPKMRVHGYKELKAVEKNYVFLRTESGHTYTQQYGQAGRLTNILEGLMLLTK